jgi:hypothetical protein
MIHAVGNAAMSQAKIAPSCPITTLCAYVGVLLAAPLLALAAAEMPDAQHHPLLSHSSISLIAEFEKDDAKAESAKSQGANEPASNRSR